MDILNDIESYVNEQVKHCSLFDYENFERGNLLNYIQLTAKEYIAKKYFVNTDDIDNQLKKVFVDKFAICVNEKRQVEESELLRYYYSIFFDKDLCAIERPKISDRKSYSLEEMSKLQSQIQDFEASKFRMDDLLYDSNDLIVYENRKNYGSINCTSSNYFPTENLKPNIGVPSWREVILDFFDANLGDLNTSEIYQPYEVHIDDLDFATFISLKKAIKGNDFLVGKDNKIRLAFTNGLMAIISFYEYSIITEEITGAKKLQRLRNLKNDYLQKIVMRETEGRYTRRSYITIASGYYFFTGKYVVEIKFKGFPILR